MSKVGPKNGINIRSSTTADLETIAVVRNACWPDYPVTGQSLALNDSFEQRQRFVLEVGGQIRAHAMLETAGYKGNRLELDVLPEYQSCGLGRTFFQRLEPHLERHSDWIVFTSELHSYASDFAQARGFSEFRRSWHSVIKVQRVDDALLTDPRVSGYDFVCYADQPDPARLFELHIELRRDIPHIEAANAPNFEQFRNRTLEAPPFVPKSAFIAVHDNQWVAYTGARQRSLDKPLEWSTVMTGTKRQHRGRGLAFALKLLAIRAAKTCGVIEMHTNNDSTNAAMLHVNHQLGYERGAAVIQMRRAS